MKKQVFFLTFLEILWTVPVVWEMVMGVACTCHQLPDTCSCQLGPRLAAAPELRLLPLCLDKYNPCFSLLYAHVYKHTNMFTSRFHTVVLHLGKTLMPSELQASSCLCSIFFPPFAFNFPFIPYLRTSSFASEEGKSFCCWCSKPPQKW